jgi:hypothetical protein
MFPKRKQFDCLAWRKLKEMYSAWGEALHDAAREVRDIQTGLWLGFILFGISFGVGLVYDIPQIPSFVRLKIIPGVLLGLFGIYLGIVSSWAISVNKFRWLKSEWERTKAEAATLSEMGDITRKPFDYLLLKIEFLLNSIKVKEQNLSTQITFISSLSEDTIKEGRMLADLSKRYNLRFEWDITEKTTKRTQLRDELLCFIVELGHTYLTGELPVFDKLLVIPGVTIIGFIKNIWFSWNLINLNVEIDEIKERIVLTPFPEKIDRFFGLSNVHSAISCYLSEVVNLEGFIIGAEHSFLWIKEPNKLFEEFTNYQKVINEKFEEVSDKLRPISTYITANLPLLDNYKVIIEDQKVREWLSELKQEARKRSNVRKDKKANGLELVVDRYIYIQGNMKEQRWEIEKEYLSEFHSFLQEDFFSDLPENYKIWVVLSDKSKMEEQYQKYKETAIIRFPYEDVVSNWIWFECENSYHVLQYEKGLKVEERVAEALAKKEVEEQVAKGLLAKEEVDEALVKARSKLSKISAFMFADAVEPNSPGIMSKYHDYKKYLHYCRNTASSLVITLTDFLDKYCRTAQK